MKQYKVLEQIGNYEVFEWRGRYNRRLYSAKRDGRVLMDHSPDLSYVLAAVRTMAAADEAEAKPDNVYDLFTGRKVA